MSWITVDDKHKRKYDRRFFSCEEAHERKYIIDTILEVFPSFDRTKVERAVDQCCRRIKASRPCKEFPDCVRESIGTM